MSEAISEHCQIDDLEFYGGLESSACQQIGLIRYQSVYDKLSDQQRAEYRKRLIRNSIEQISELIRAHQPEFVVILGDGSIYGSENGVQYEPDANWRGLTSFLYPSLINIESPLL